MHNTGCRIAEGVDANHTLQADAKLPPTATQAAHAELTGLSRQYQADPLLHLHNRARSAEKAATPTTGSSGLQY